MKFEEAMKQLEEISRAIEREEIGLDESLALYAQGAELIKTCNQMLDDAEQKINEANEL